MARGVKRPYPKNRKPASDSRAALLAKAQEPDMSAARAPRDIVGAENLNEYGLAVLDRLYRQKCAWTEADLQLIAIAASAQQQLRAVEEELVATGLMVTTAYTTKPNPLLTVSELLSNRVSKSLQAAGLRQRDGKEPEPVKLDAATPGGKTFSMKDILN